MIRSAACGAAAIFAASALACSFNSAAAVAAAAATVSPSGIDATGASDVTAALQTLIDSLPDGSTLSFPPDGKYRIEGTLQVDGKHDVTIDGHESLFFATTTGDRTRSQWEFVNDDNIVVRDVAVKGANPNAGTSDAAYVASLEAQHGFDIISTDGIELDHVTVTDVYGDFVYIGGHGDALTRDVYVHDSTFDRNGRQGISVTGGDGVRIVHNTIGDTRRATFDLEPNGADWGAFNVDIEYNTIGAGRLNLVSSAGRGPVANITFSHNVINRAPNIYIAASDHTRRGPFTITDNVATQWWGGAAGGAALTFQDVDGVTVKGNTLPLQPRRGDYAVKALDSCDISVSSNTFTNAVADTYVTPGPGCTPTSPTPTQPTSAQEPPAPPPTHGAPAPPTAPVVTVPIAPTGGPTLIAAPPQPPSPTQAGDPAQDPTSGTTDAPHTTQPPAAAPAPKAKNTKKAPAVAGGGAKKSGPGNAVGSGQGPNAATGDDAVYLDAETMPITSDSGWNSHMRRRILYAALAACLLLLMGLRLRRSGATQHRPAMRTRPQQVRTAPHHPGLAATAWHAPGIQPRRHG